MKIVTASNGKKTLKMSRKEWENIGKKAGWEKEISRDEILEKIREYEVAISDFAEMCKGEGSDQQVFDNTWGELWNKAASCIESIHSIIKDDKVYDGIDNRLISLHKGLYAQIFFSKFPDYGKDKNNKSGQSKSIFRDEAVISRCKQVLEGVSVIKSMI